MPTTTPRLSLTQPIGTDPPSQLRISITGHANTLDNAAIFLSGTLLNRPAASIQGRYYLATDDTSSGSSIGTLYLDTGAAWVAGFNPPSRGATNIVGPESRTNVAYGTLPTPDQVSGIVLPTNGLIRLWYQATWQESVAGAARAAIFIGSNQLTVASLSNVPATQAAATNSGSTAQNHALASCPVGLVSRGVLYNGDVTTGQTIGLYSSSSDLAAEFGGGVQNVYGTATQTVTGGSCEIFAVTGTYTVSVQFKASSGSVTASNRKLWVQALPFS